jgi:hypothetical protein
MTLEQRLGAMKTLTEIATKSQTLIDLAEPTLGEKDIPMPPDLVRLSFYKLRQDVLDLATIVCLLLEEDIRNA